MSRAQTIAVASESDVVRLRVQVRDLARAIGMSLTDQARISLAASSVAKAIGLGSTCRGQATIDDCRQGERTGVRVIYKEKNGKGDLTSGVFGDTRWMVDELTVETLPTNEVQVTLIKWRV